MGVYAPLKEIDTNLPNCEIIEILVMTKNFIFFRNSVGGLQQLNPGDQVQYGRFKSIQFEKKEALFVINKIGIWENIIVPFQGGIK